MTGGELTEDKDGRPGENVILVSGAAQGPGLPDGALEGLAKWTEGNRREEEAALGLQTVSLYLCAQHKQEAGGGVFVKPV